MMGRCSQGVGSWARSAAYCLLTLHLLGCAHTREPVKPARTAIGQLLLTQAVERALADVTVPLPEGASVIVETSGLTPDQTYLRDAVVGRLGSQGARIRDRAEDASHRVQVMVQALGTEVGQTFWGMPPVQGGLLPISLPELALYKSVRQTGYARFSLDVFERATGRFLHSTPWYTRSVYWNQYTVFFVLNFRSSNLVLPP